jgi:hypothetical protein
VVRWTMRAHPRTGRRGYGSCGSILELIPMAAWVPSRTIAPHFVGGMPKIAATTLIFPYRLRSEVWSHLLPYLLPFSLEERICSLCSWEFSPIFLARVVSSAGVGTNCHRPTPNHLPSLLRCLSSGRSQMHRKPGGGPHKQKVCYPRTGNQFNSLGEAGNRATARLRGSGWFA